MTSDQQPFYYKKLTQTSYRQGTSNEGAQLEVALDADLSEYSKKDIQKLKARIEEEVNCFVDLLLPEDKRLNGSKDALFTYLCSVLKL